MGQPLAKMEPMMSYASSAAYISEPICTGRAYIDRGFNAAPDSAYYQKWNEWSCEYCGNTHDMKRKQCRTCGAPRGE